MNRHFRYYRLEYVPTRAGRVGGARARGGTRLATGLRAGGLPSPALVLDWCDSGLAADLSC